MQQNNQLNIRSGSERTDHLQRLCANGRLTQDGKEWLTLALDPFHDYNHQVAGYPDTDSSQTVVSCYNFQTELKAPAGVAGNWDAHIFSMPLVGTDQFQVRETNAAFTLESAYNPIITATMSMLNIWTNAANAPLYPKSPVHPTFASTCLPGSPMLELENGNSRVIGVGWEVTNTTAEINKQGSVTVYKMPQAHGDNYWVTHDVVANTYQSMVGKRLRLPPKEVSAANLLKGTKTWDAQQGVYAVPTMSNVSNPLQGPMLGQAVFADSAGPTGAIAQVISSNYTTVVSQPGSSLATPDTIKLCPYDTTGAFFEGLSNSTTLTIKLRIYLEKAPTSAEAALAVLATPSAGYDVAALEMYAQTCSYLPPAVRVTDNASGDWWRSVMRVVGHVAPVVGNLVGNFVPGAALAGKAVQSLSGALGRNNQSAAERAASSIQAVAQAIKQYPQKNGNKVARPKKDKKANTRPKKTK